jgi:hypothetical protein
VLNSHPLLVDAALQPFTFYDATFTLQPLPATSSSSSEAVVIRKPARSATDRQLPAQLRTYKAAESSPNSGRLDAPAYVPGAVPGIAIGVLMPSSSGGMPRMALVF